MAIRTGRVVAKMGGQSFYAEEIHVGLWCAIGVMLRLYVERSRLVVQVNGVSVAHTCVGGDITVSQTRLDWANYA